MNKYSFIVCGGTFDLLHLGHKNFLKKVFNISDKVIIGLTSDLYVNKHKDQYIENYEKRKKSLTNFLEEIGVLERAEILRINDIYGPLLDKNFNVDAMAVTSETEKNTLEINNKRHEIGLQKLHVEVIQMDLAEDGKLISSTRIRKGEINRLGKVYINKYWKEKTLKLPQILRSEFQKPFGRILYSVPKDLNGSRVITIGDITTKEFNKNRINQFISIIDFQVQRKNKFNNTSELGFDEKQKVIKIKNPAGVINGKIFDVISNELNDKYRKLILVDGEEDLIVIPAVLIAPLGFNIYYGQPNVGLVEVVVTEENKERAYNLINKFSNTDFDN